MDPNRLKKKRPARPNRMKANPRRSLKSTLVSVTLQTVLQSYRFASFIKSVPFEVIKGPKLRIRLFQSKWKTYLWYFSTAIICAYGMFQAYSFPHVIWCQGLTTESALHMAYVITFSLGVLYFGFMFRYDSTYVGLINAIDSLQIWTEDWMHDRWTKAPFAVITVNYFAVILATVVPANVIVFLIAPKYSRYAFSVLPAIMQDRLEVLLLGMVLEGLISLWITSLLHVSYCYWSMIVFQQLFWLDDLCKTTENCGLDLNKWQRIFSFYRSLQCLNTVHNNMYRHFASGFLVIIGATAVAALYCTLKAFHLLPLWIYVFFPAFVVFILVLILALVPFIAKWEQRSADFAAIALYKLRPLRLRNEEFDALYKEARAMQVIGNEIGHFTLTRIETAEGTIRQIIDHLLLSLSF